MSTNCINNTKKIVHRINAECAEHHRIKVDEFLLELSAVRTQGFSVSFDENGYGMIGIQLPSSAEEETLALTVVADAEQVHARLDDIVQILRGVIARAFAVRETGFENTNMIGLLGRAV